MNRFLFILMLVLFSCNNNDDLAVDKFDPSYYIKDNVVVTPAIDTTSLIRNPCMGWVVYDDAWLETEDAQKYWAAQDENANKYASIFFIRYRWSDMEPREGVYAWENNPNFIYHIEQAQKRGIKLAFAIYTDAKDNLWQSTPDFVRQAGAEGYMTTGLYDQFWTPYPDDPIFQQKLSNFIKAFAAKFDNPDIVDFVNGVNLGWWGECNNVRLKDPTKMREVYDWITSTYGNAFKNVILVSNFVSDFGYATEKEIGADKNGYAFRRDGLGSFWFRDVDRLYSLDARKNNILLIGEGAYWKGNDDNPSYKPWANDSRMPANPTWRDFYNFSLSDALTYGYNTLDLREVVETTGWVKYGNDLVHQFIRHGGYRFEPVELSVPLKMYVGQQFAVGHSWRNSATGCFPNNNKRWNYKYKVAFALLDGDKPIHIWVDRKAEPSDWENTIIYNNIFIGDVPQNINRQTYAFAFSIVDVTKDCEPSIALPVKDNVEKKWIKLDNITVL